MGMTELCAELHNYFSDRNSIYDDFFTIVGGKLTVDFLKEGQYYCIIGSVFNDGVHVYGDADLEDEEFEGEIWAMKVPPAVVEICRQIDEWREKNEDINSANMSPYTSESFGNYSYSKGAQSSDGSSGVSWQGQFASRLNAYRKVGGGSGCL